jgi:hypothetical protein
MHPDNDAQRFRQDHLGAMLVNWIWFVAGFDQKSHIYAYHSSMTSDATMMPK